jgi:hypothetical protein
MIKQSLRKTRDTVTVAEVMFSSAAMKLGLETTISVQFAIHYLAKDIYSMF